MDATKNYRVGNTEVKDFEVQFGKKKVHRVVNYVTTADAMYVMYRRLR